MRNPILILFQRQSRRRDFSRDERGISNPLFAGRPRGGKMGYVVTFVVVVALGTFLLVSPEFRITSVRIDGAQKIDPASVERFVSGRLNETFLGVAWRRVTFLTPTNDLVRELRHAVERIISLSELTIKREERHTLIVTMKERTPNLIWTSTSGRSYFVDENGFIVEPIEGDAPATFLKIRDANGLAATNGAQVLLPSLIAGVRTIEDRLGLLSITPTSFATWAVECPRPTPSAGEAPTERSRGTTDDNRNAAPVEDDETSEGRVLPRRTPELEPPCDPSILALHEPTLVVMTGEQWEIRFDTRGNLDEQVQKLGITLRERFQNNRPQEYIDVRFGDRVFFK